MHTLYYQLVREILKRTLTESGVASVSQDNSLGNQGARFFGWMFGKEWGRKPEESQKKREIVSDKKGKIDDLPLQINDQKNYEMFDQFIEKLQKEVEEASSAVDETATVTGKFLNKIRTDIQTLKGLFRDEDLLDQPYVDPRDCKDSTDEMVLFSFLLYSLGQYIWHTMDQKTALGNERRALIITRLNKCRSILDAINSSKDNKSKFAYIETIINTLELIKSENIEVTKQKTDESWWSVINVPLKFFTFVGFGLKIDSKSYRYSSDNINGHVNTVLEVAKSMQAKVQPKSKTGRQQEILQPTPASSSSVPSSTSSDSGTSADASAPTSSEAALVVQQSMLNQQPQKPASTEELGDLLTL